jgi:hypothetical protein
MPPHLYDDLPSVFSQLPLLFIAVAVGFFGGVLVMSADRFKNSFSSDDKRLAAQATKYGFNVLNAAVGIAWFAPMLFAGATYALGIFMGMMSAVGVDNWWANVAAERRSKQERTPPDAQGSDSCP